MPHRLLISFPLRRRLEWFGIIHPLPSGHRHISAHQLSTWVRIHTTAWATTLCFVCFFCQEPFLSNLSPDMTSTSGLSNMQRMVEQLKLEASVERIKVRTNRESFGQAFLFIALISSSGLKRLLLAATRAASSWAVHTDISLICSLLKMYKVSVLQNVAV